METVSKEKKDRDAKLSWKENIGWIGMIVTVGIMVQQLWSHFDSLAQYYVPKILDGRLFEILGSADPMFTPLFKFVYPLEFADSLFFFGFAIIALIQLLRRKAGVPRMLSVYMLIAGCYNVGHLVLVYLLPPELEMVTVLYTVECIIFLAVNTLLYLFYRKSNTFKALFIR
jgi:hypothetical protein